MMKGKKYILLIAFAILLSLPFLVPGCGPLALIAFVPLLKAEHEFKKGWLWYFSAFLAFNIITTFWIWNVSEVGSVVAIVLNALQMSAVFALYRSSRRTLEQRFPNLPQWVAPLILATLWMAWEHIYFNVEISWPWLVLGNAFASSTKLVQWYEISGTLGGSLWIFLSNILIYCSLSGRTKQQRTYWAVAAALVIILPATASILRYYSYRESEASAEVVVIQPNIDPFSKYGVIPQQEIDSRMLKLAQDCLTPSTDLIITPETFTFGVDIDEPLDHPSISAYQSFLSDYPHTQMIVGAFAYRWYNSMLQPSASAKKIRQGLWRDSFNASMIIDSSKVYSHYFKSKLVPGVEIIPYQRYLPFLSKIIERFGGGSGSYGIQDEMDALQGREGSFPVGTMICYESIYGDFSRKATLKGAQLLTVITNDGWWGDTPGYRQHFRFARLRAIENRRDVVQAANTGTSGIINQRGDMLIRTGWWEETSLRSTVNLNTDITPFVKYGDVIGRCSAWMALIILLTVFIFYVSGKRYARGKSA